MVLVDVTFETSGWPDFKRQNTLVEDQLGRPALSSEYGGAWWAGDKLFVPMHYRCVDDGQAVAVRLSVI